MSEKKVKYGFGDVISSLDIASGKVEETDVLFQKGYLTCHPVKLGHCIKDDKVNELCYGMVTHVDEDGVMMDASGLKWHYFIPEKHADEKPSDTVKKEEHKFRKGDTVRLISNYHGIPESYISRIGYISEEPTGEFVYVTFDNGGCYKPEFIVEMWQIESVDDKENDAAQNDECISDGVFKVGDRIKLIRADHGIGGEWVGRCATIEAHEYDNCYLAKFDYYDAHFFVYDGMIEKISDKEDKKTEKATEDLASVIVPFDFSRQEDRDAVRDRWVRCKQNKNEYRISAFKHSDNYGWQAHLNQVGLRTPQQLLANYTFLNGASVGKLKGESNG